MPGMNLGIDLGTSQVVIAVSDRGVVLRQPSVIAVDRDSDKTIACGREAYEMLGRSPDSIRVIRPLAKGVISDYQYAERMLRSFVRQVCAYKVLKPKVAVSVPASITEVERRSAVEAAMASGARRAVLIEESVAAAIGAGVDVAAPRGCMVADIGGGTTDAAVLTLKGMASSVSLRKGGDDLDEAIVRYVHNRYGLIIGRQTAEQMKIAIGTADPDQTGEETMPVKGRDAVKGLPRTREISAREVYEAMEEPLDEIISSLQRVLENTPPELVGDVYDTGILLTGGLARLKGLDSRIAQKAGVACRVAEQPEDCVALGTAKASRYVKIMSTGVYDINQFSYRLSDMDV